MRLQPIVYAIDTLRVVDWYRRVFDIEPSFRSDMWTTFDLGGATLAIHRIDRDLPVGSRVEISLVASEPLETLILRLESAGVEISRGIQDETFGRSLLLTDPDGSVIQVNEHG